ncbi:MAG: preprotein translocase subunit SecE [Bdellovibrionota bacterium]
MENNNNKTISICFMVAGILVALVASVLMETLAAVGTGAFGRFVAQDAARLGFPIVLGIVTIAALYSNKGVFTWADEVVTEISRVVWPSRKDTIGMTIVVCVMVLISGVFFGILDVTSGAIIDWLLHRDIF